MVRKYCGADMFMCHIMTLFSHPVIINCCKVSVTKYGQEKYGFSKLSSPNVSEIYMVNAKTRRACWLRVGDLGHR